MFTQKQEVAEETDAKTAKGGAKGKQPAQKEGK